MIKIPVEIDLADDIKRKLMRACSKARGLPEEIPLDRHVEPEHQAAHARIDRTKIAATLEVEVTRDGKCVIVGFTGSTENERLAPAATIERASVRNAE